MKSLYDSIYLSPHLDDAVLSCGGQIYQQIQSGRTVLVVTVMAGEPSMSSLSDFAQELHDRWGTGKRSVAIRRQEDIAAIELLGADYLHWPIPDCIYRLDPASGRAFYTTEDALFGNIPPNDIGLLESILQRLHTLPAHRKLLVPLSVGNHVDHQITRLAAERWLKPEYLIYYEDYPYARIQEAVLSSTRPEDHWASEIIELSQEALKAKICATALYTSQIHTFFANLEDLSRQINDYCRRIGGERIWRKRPAR